jgi:GT2 family glycosyltransferase
LGKKPTIVRGPYLSVIIPTWRRFEPVLETVDALLTQQEVDFEIVVVDQNLIWPEDLRERKERVAANARVNWSFRDEAGVVAARHDAVEIATGDILVFVDDDVAIPDPFFLARHAVNYEALSDLDVVVGREVYLGQALPPVSPFPPSRGYLTRGTRVPGTPRDQAIGFDRMRSDRYEVIAFCTCNSSVRREAFLRVGGFDESFYGNAYGDDYDFAIRLGESGGRFVYDPQAWLIHLQAKSGGLRMSDQKTQLGEKEKIYSSVLFMLKNWQRPWRLYLLWRVLRRSLFLKANLKRPWREIAVCLGLWRGWREARVAVRRGAWSRFARGTSKKLAK